MALFGKKKKEEEGQPNIPTDKILELRQQGYSNDQIIQTLQQQGYESSQIYDGLSQADIKNSVGGGEEQMPPAPPGGPRPQSQPQPPQQPESQQQYTQPSTEAPSYGMPQAQPSAGGIDRNTIEEIAESIIDEKWDELMENVGKIVEWKDAAESRIDKMEQNIKNLKERFESLHSGILKKVKDYDTNIKEVGTDIKAMEKVFKKTLPKFTENINELSNITEKIKSKKKKSKKKKK